MRKIGIIGGGLAGLTVAYELVKKGFEVVVLEKNKGLGGLAGGFKKENWDWSLEFFYHHVFQSDGDFLDLAEELGVAERVFFVRPKTSVYLEGKTAALDSAGSVLRFPYLSLLDRLRLGTGAAALKFSPYISWYEKLGAHRVLPLLVGKKAYSKIWEPLLRQKFSLFYNLFYKSIPLSWFWARIKARTSRLGYFQGGFSGVAEALAEAIKEKGGEILLGCRVEEIRKKGGCFEILSSRGKFEFEKLILALPLPVALELGGGILKEERKKYDQLKMLGAAVLILRLRKKFFTDNTYWLNITDPDFPFVAAVEHTNFVNKKYYGGEHLVYFGGYYPGEDEIFQMKKRQVWRLFWPFIQRLNPAVNKDDILGFEVFSSLFAQPVPRLNYSQTLVSDRCARSLLVDNASYSPLGSGNEFCG
jgi:protoporphyrinogen oxidase